MIPEGVSEREIPENFDFKYNTKGILGSIPDGIIEFLTEFREGTSVSLSKKNLEEIIEKILQEFWKKYLKESPLKFLEKSMKKKPERNFDEIPGGIPEVIVGKFLQECWKASPKGLLEESYKGELAKFRMEC